MLKTVNKSNYLAKVVRLEGGIKHPNADKLKIFKIDFQDCITDLSYSDKDVCIYFPVLSKVNPRLISFINGFQDSTLNKNTSIRGYMSSKSVVKATNLRGSKSQGLLIKVEIFEDWLKNETNKSVKISDDSINQEFDYYNDIQICEKYIIPVKNSSENNKSNKKVVRKSRLVADQFRLHNDTENLRKNIYKINPNDIIGIHYKKHGCVSSDTIIETLEFGEKTIKEIVQKKLKCHIKAFDVDNKEIVYAEVDDYYFKKNHGEWFEIELENGKTIKITSNNPVWLPSLNCYREVKDLMVGDILLVD